MYDITEDKKPVWVAPDDHENFEFVLKGKRDFPDLFDSHIEAIDRALTVANPTRAKTLRVETMADVGELFDSVGGTIFPEGTRDRTDLRSKLILIYVGGMVRWRASTRDATEGWKCYRQETGKKDQWSGRSITKSFYWKEPLPSREPATAAQLDALRIKTNQVFASKNKTS